MKWNYAFGRVVRPRAPMDAERFNEANRLYRESMAAERVRIRKEREEKVEDEEGPRLG